MENIISSEEKIAELYRKHGVVVFIFDPDDNVLVTKEVTAQESTGKSVGDYGVLCETTEPGEFVATTVIRGIREELGVEEEQQETKFSISQENGYLGETIFIEGVLARVFLLHANESYNFSPSQEFSDEVEIAGGFSLNELSVLQLRSGVRNVLDDISRSGLQLHINAPDDALVPLTRENLLQVLSGFK
jgi:isopentenyldiphosphate isomerase